MLKEEYLNDIPDSVVDIWGDLEEWIIKDICSRIMSAELYNYDKIPGAAQWRIELLREAGMHYSDIAKVIARITKKSEAEVRKLFEESGMLCLDEEAEMYRRQGIEPLDLMHSEVLKGILQDVYNRANGEIRNFTRTTADASQKLFIDTLDKVYFDVTTGARSYSEAIKEAVETVGQEAGKVHYNTGHKDTVETAIRRAVLTGINQGAGKLSVAQAQELGAEYVVVSSHIGARTSEDPIANHAGWQGKIYKIDGADEYPNLLDSTGFPLNPLGLCGYNCRHSIHAYFLGEPNPFEDIVKDQKASDKLYELTQKQRYMERNIRSTRKKLLAYETAMANCQDEKTRFELSLEYDKCAAKLQKQNKKYNEFCKENAEYGIKPERERLKTLNWKRENADKARSGARSRNDIKKYVEKSSQKEKKKKSQTLDNSVKNSTIKVNSRGQLDTGYIGKIPDDKLTEYNKKAYEQIKLDTGYSDEQATELHNAFLNYFGGDYEAILSGETEIAKIIKEGISRMPTYDGTIYRGMLFDKDTIKKFSNLKIGDTLPRKGIIESWSSNERTAISFCGVNSYERNSVLLECVNNRTGVGVQHISKFGDREAEVLAVANYEVVEIVIESKYDYLLTHKEYLWFPDDLDWCSEDMKENIVCRIKVREKN